MPLSAARLVLPTLITPFLKAYPDIQLQNVNLSDRHRFEGWKHA